LKTNLRGCTTSEVVIVNNKEQLQISAIALYKMAESNAISLEIGQNELFCAAKLRFCFMIETLDT